MYRKDFPLQYIPHEMTAEIVEIIVEKVMYLVRKVFVDKAPRPRISHVIWILSLETICQLNKSFSNSEAAMLSRYLVM